MKSYIKVEDVSKHETIFKTQLSFKPVGSMSYSVHEVELKATHDDLATEYFIFTLISGTSVMNWIPEDYTRAQNFLDIGDTHILVVTTEGGEPVHVPDSYRN